MEDKEKAISEMMGSSQFKEAVASITTSIKDLQDRMQSTISSFSESMKAWELRNEIEFKKTLKSVKHILKQKGLALPKDWKEVYYKWYMEKCEEELSFSDLTKKIGDRQILIQWAVEYSDQIEIIPKEQSEKLDNLNHKLCILDDLGILNLIEEKFNYKKGYSGTAPVKDKARLIASILDIENYKRVEYALKNNDFKSDRQIKNACETLKNHGLKPNNLTD